MQVSFQCNEAQAARAGQLREQLPKEGDGVDVPFGERLVAGGDYKVPRVYEFIAALPRNALGKVLKRELRGDTQP